MFILSVAVFPNLRHGARLFALVLIPTGGQVWVLLVALAAPACDIDIFPQSLKLYLKTDRPGYSRTSKTPALSGSVFWVQFGASSSVMLCTRTAPPV